MANKRIYYAVHSAAIEGDGGDWNFDTLAYHVHGLQSVTIATNFNLEQAFELGQQSIYENIEEIPDVEVTLNKVLDGYPLLYHLATFDATSPSLAGRSIAKCKFALGIWPDTNESATGSADSVVACSGMFVSAVTYNFPLDDNFDEEITLVGNHKIWKNGDAHLTNPNPSLPWSSIDMDGAFTGNNDAPIGLGGVNRRQDLQYTATSGTTDVNGMIADPDATILPPDVFGISSSGTNDIDGDGNYGAHLSNISVSVDFGREEINELGRRAPYHRVVTFPVEVTCEIEVTSTSGDLVSATEEGIYTTGTDPCEDAGNLLDRTIRISTCEGTRIYLGTKNKLASVNYSGGDANGGNVTVTYSFTTFNDFIVIHSGDPNASGSTWWTNRSTYLVDL